MKKPAANRIDESRRKRGPFVVAAETSCMPMIFTDALEPGNAIVFANDSFLALTGFTKNQLLGRPLDMILFDLAESEKGNRRDLTPFRAALERGDDGNWDMECQRIDQTRFKADVFLSAVHDEKGILSQHFLCFVALDGSYQRQLKRRNELHALYEAAPGFIATTQGPDHVTTFANASYKRFVGRDDVEGLTVAEALPEIVRQGFIDILDQVYQTGIPFRGTGVAIDLVDSFSGETVRRYANFVSQPVPDDSGAVVGLFCEGYDVTGQREATDSLAQVQAELIHLSRVSAMGTMAVTLAHELNQPLSAIANYTSGGLRLIDADANPDDPIARALLAIDEASQSASNIIRTLRDLTRKRHDAPQPFDLKPAIEESIRLVRAATLPNVEFADKTPSGLDMMADRIQIQQVVINLLRNAADAVATSDRKTVTVNATLDDDMIVVCIADTGPGVSLKAAENIFVWSDSAKESGMGLGLSICRTIIESYRGRIWLEKSSAIGSELCFSIPVQLPLDPGLTEPGLLVAPA